MGLIKLTRLRLRRSLVQTEALVVEPVAQHKEVSKSNDVLAELIEA